MTEKRLLDNLITQRTGLENSIQSGQIEKRARKDIGQPTFPVLFALFTDLRNKVRSMSIDVTKLEVEVRFGMIVARNRRCMSISLNDTVYAIDDDNRQARGLSFKAGVDESMADKLKRILTSEGFKAEVQPTRRQRSNNSSRDRWDIDLSGKIQRNIENKRKFLRCNLALLSHHYDIRLDAASEIPHTQVGGDEGFNPDDWDIERLKQRVSYLPPTRPGHGDSALWKVDLTEVETTVQRTAEVTREVEVELEMMPRSMQAWLNAPDGDEAARATNAVASQLYLLLQLCIPSCREAAEGKGATRDPPLVPYPQEPTVMTCIANDNRGIRSAAGESEERSDGPGFVGSMPVNISRRGLLDIQRHRFFLTEKSDGIRHLLYIVQDSSGGLQAVIMDRAKHLHKLHGSTLTASALKLGTVLDGELVFNRTSHRTHFLVFDVLAIDGTPVVQESFESSPSTPYICITWCLTCRVQHLVSGEAPFTRVVPKAFYPKEHIGKLLTRLTWEGGNRVYRDKGCLDIRHHKSDGIIFQPNTPYQISTDSRLMKWKWPELCSIDLQVGPANDKGVQSLICRGPDGVDIDCTTRGRDRVGLGVFDGWRLAADSEDSMRNVNIAEVAYNPEIGLWSYFQLRKDKTEPNFIHTVLGVFMEQAEAISVEELEYRLLARNAAENDYTAQCASMKRKALDWQRKRTEITAPSTSSSGAR